MEQKIFEELKRAIFTMGLDYVDEFLGYQIDVGNYSKDELDNMMDEAYQQMPEDKLNEFYEKFCV